LPNLDPGAGAPGFMLIPASQVKSSVIDLPDDRQIETAG
jgi:hypothetical protein